MFVLSRLRCLVSLKPNKWDDPLPEAIKAQINSKLANKVLHDVGLVMGVFDIVDLGNSFLFPGDGASHTKVTFRSGRGLKCVNINLLFHKAVTSNIRTSLLHLTLIAIFPEWSFSDLPPRRS